MAPKCQTCYLWGVLATFLFLCTVASGQEGEKINYLEKMAIVNDLFSPRHRSNFDLQASQKEVIDALGHFLQPKILADITEISSVAFANVFHSLNNSSEVNNITKAMSNDTAYDVSTECLKHTEMLLIGLFSKKQWALKMLDAVGKPPSGLEGGNLRWLGSYDECVAVEAIVDNTAAYKGKYCMASFQMGGDMNSLAGQYISLFFGLCVPSSCSDQDTKALLKTAIFALPFNTSAIPEPSVSCQAESLDLNTKSIVIICVCSAFAVLILMATGFDILAIQMKAICQPPKLDKSVKYMQNHFNNGSFTQIEEGPNGFPVKKGSDPISLDMDTNTTKTQSNGLQGSESETHDKKNEDTAMEAKDYKPGILGKILLSFSVYTNASKILNTSQPAGALTAVNGIRFLSMSWVILGHTYAFSILYGQNLRTFTEKIMARFTFQAVANASFSVDSFFVLSGILVAYLSLKQMKKDGGARKFNWGLYYFHRFWRLTPPYALLMLVYAPLVKYWSDGPMWPQKGTEINECEDSWWTNLLYINNIYKVEKSLHDAYKTNRRVRIDTRPSCMAWSWYLANDMQFFVISPLLLIPLYYSPAVGGIVCLAFLLECFISRGLISADHDYPANLLLRTGGGNAMYDLYFKPWSRIGPYIIGIFTGYLLYKTNCRVKLPKVINLLCWSAATAVGLAVLYGLYVPDGNNSVNNLSTEMAALYNSLGRTAWGVALAWVIFACATGNGGFVNTLLSWSPFVLLGRLTYCAYLVHPIVIYVYLLSRRTPIYFTDLEITYQFFGHICASYLIAFCVSLVFESPMMGLEKAILGRNKNS